MNLNLNCLHIFLGYRGIKVHVILLLFFMILTLKSGIAQSLPLVPLVMMVPYVFKSSSSSSQPWSCIWVLVFIQHQDMYAWTSNELEDIVECLLLNMLPLVQKAYSIITVEMNIQESPWPLWTKLRIEPFSKITPTKISDFSSTV